MTLNEKRYLVKALLDRMLHSNPTTKIFGCYARVFSKHSKELRNMVRYTMIILLLSSCIEETEWPLEKDPIVIYETQPLVQIDSVKINCKIFNSKPIYGKSKCK